ncbi:MAG: metal-sensing transcriptional repressor [Lachnospiraceae bacterium]|nr:metal-sensing transcriptional repressor [Lachnospiraceae bacterium]MBQ2318465.1 metal-sensing transcriptional repressor [Lachnospiraceae bacterium]MBR6282303.1 metal-sensing transcriptional repressor [Lachnospiraceae bacterium]
MATEHTHEHAHEHTHLHTYADGDSLGRTHTHTVIDENGVEHTYTHTHSHEQTKAVINRMNRAIGHMESVKRMVEDGRDCSEILIQIAAVRSAINNIGKIILEDHISHTVVDAVQTGDQDVLDDLKDAINKFIK